MSTLSVQIRDGAVKVHKLRREGILPMALMRRDHTTTLIQGKEEDFRKALKAADGLGRVDVAVDGGKAMKAIVRKIEKDFRSPNLVHAVLQEISADDTMRLDVSVVAVGTPPSVADGEATLLQQSAQIKLKGKMSDIPDHLEVDVSHLEVGHHVSAGEIPLPEGVTLLSSPDSTVFTVSLNRAASLTPETLMPGEPGAGEAEASTEESTE